MRLQPRPGREFQWLLLAVFVSAAFVRWLFLYGPIGSDDTRYINGALLLASGNAPGGGDPAHTRAVFIIWLAFWSKLGLEPAQLVLSQVAVSALQATALFWVGTMLVDRVSAALSACFWILFPVELVYGGVLTPDQLGVALGLTALGFFIRGLRDPERESIMDGFLAGAIAALAYSTKEPYLLIPIIFAVWSLRRLGLTLRLRSWMLVLGSGFLIVTVFEHLFFATWTGDWLYRYRVLAGGLAATGVFSEVSVNSFLFYTRDVLANFAVSGMFGWILLVGFVASIRNLNEYRLVILWTVAFFAFLQFASTSIREYSLLPMQPRYVGPIVVLLFIPMGLTIRRLAVNPPLRLGGTIILVLALLSQGIGVARERMKQGLYFGDAPASAMELISNPTFQDRISGLTVLVPSTFIRKLTPDLQEGGVKWQALPEDALVAASTTLIKPGCGCALLVPTQWSTEATGRLGEEGGAITIPVIHAITPLDEILAGGPLSRGWLRGRLRARAAERVVGHLYLPLEARRDR